MAKWTASLLAIGCGLVAGCASLPPVEPATVVMGVDIIPMDRDRILRNQAVEIRGDRISHIAPAGAYRPPPGARIEAPCGRFLMPGLSDMHMHVPALTSDRAFLRSYLDHGVTTIRALSGDPGLLALRQAISEGRVEGPRLWVSGPVITGPPNANLDPGRQVVVANPSEARAAVAEQVRAGYDVIKLYDGMDEASFLAAAHEAEGRRAHVVAHLPDQIPLETALTAGVDEVAHADELLSYHWVGYDPRTEDWQRGLDFDIDRQAIPATVSRLRRHGLAVVSNLVTDETVYRGIADPDALLRGAEYRDVATATLAAWRASGRFIRWRGQEAYRRDRIQPFLKDLVLAIDRAGIPLLAGSDLGVEGIVAGYSLWRELEILEEAGLSSYRTLATATRNAALVAQRMGQSPDWGVVAPGHRADLLLLRDNPLESVRNLRSLCKVYTAGKAVAAKRTQSMLADKKR